MTVLVTRGMGAIAAATTTKKTSDILISTNLTCDASCYAESHGCFTQPYPDIFTSPFHCNFLISTSFCFIFCSVSSHLVYPPACCCRIHIIYTLHYGTLRWEKSSTISATEVKKFSGKQSI